MGEGLKQYSSQKTVSRNTPAAHDIHDRCRGKEGGEFHTYLHTALIDICKTNEKFHFDT